MIGSFLLDRIVIKRLLLDMTKVGTFMDIGAQGLDVLLILQ